MQSLPAVFFSWLTCPYVKKLEVMVTQKFRNSQRAIGRSFSWPQSTRYTPNKSADVWGFGTISQLHIGPGW